MSSESAVISLSRLELGRKARVVGIRASGELGRRLRDMGLVPGEEVQMTGRAPLQDPVSLRLRGFTLSLRNSEADQIAVEPCT
ncbi:MAG: ferrous iron transport protein A [Deltaproteobacteria bacterium]|jgi:ferrous iron transport protein A|nr:ferrous iron transport protein A [Deltaproteobacteria bacterium]